MGPSFEGEIGTFMDGWHHARYFAPVRHNLDASFKWSDALLGDQRVPPLVQASRDVYEAVLAERIASAQHRNDLADLERVRRVYIICFFFFFKRELFVRDREERTLPPPLSPTRRRLPEAGGSGGPPQVLAFWYAWSSRQQSDFDPPPFVCLSELLHLWHEHERGSHHELHECSFKGHTLLLLNAKESPYAALKPKDLAPLTQRNCPVRHWKNLGRG